MKEYGWNAYFSTLVGACAIALLLLSPMTKLRSYVQREAVSQGGRAGGRERGHRERSVVRGREGGAAVLQLGERGGCFR